MYFPALKTMACFSNDSLLINKLDVWLGTRRKAVQKNLNPLQFSLDFDIKEDTAIALFALCTGNSVKILKERFNVECSCNSILGCFGQVPEIPKVLHCDECGQPKQISKDMIVIWYELIQNPKPQNIKIHDKESTSTLGNRGGK